MKSIISVYAVEQRMKVCNFCEGLKVFYYKHLKTILGYASSINMRAK